MIRHGIPYVWAWPNHPYLQVESNFVVLIKGLNGYWTRGDPAMTPASHSTEVKHATRKCHMIDQIPYTNDKNLWPNLYNRITLLLTYD